MRIARSLVGEWTGRHARALARLDGSRAAIFTYHRVLPTIEARDRDVEPGMFVTPETFARHTKWLANEFSVLPLADLIKRFAAGDALPDMACAITFDDGWRDNYTHAWPCLERLGLPATIFLVASRVGSQGRFWTDDVWSWIRNLPAARCTELLSVSLDSPSAVLEHLKTLHPEDRAAAIEHIQTTLGVGPASTDRELMDWEEVAAMAKRDISFECHGNSHSLLTTLDDGAVAIELSQAQETLLAHGVGNERLLAYPNGSWDERVAKIAQRQGIRAAVTTERKLANRNDALHSLPRIGVHDDVSRTRPCFRRLISNA